MAGKKKETKKSDEQLDLIDVAPENAKPIIEVACQYKQHQRARMAAGAKEEECKKRILNMVNEANLQRLEGGKIKFEYDSVTISITPRDELVTVKDKTESE